MSVEVVRLINEYGYVREETFLTDDFGNRCRYVWLPCIQGYFCDPAPTKSLEDEIYDPWGRYKSYWKPLENNT